ncbi:MAG: hypothetical protein INR70_00460 [Parafilimonas terrae]|nr:hypothetical protein [Parafilimonas terrae]
MDDLPAGFRIVTRPQSAPADDLPPGFRVVPAAAAGAPEQPSVAVDVAKALPTGAAKGAIGLAGLPGDVQHMGGSLVDDIMLGLGHKVMDWSGYGPQAGTPERADFDRMYRGIGSGGGLPGSGAIRQGVETVTGPLYEPKTTAGQYAQTVGEFATGAAIGPGGLARKAAETVIPAAVSETAGQLTKGSKAEPVARLAGALAGNLGTAAVAARTDAPARAVGTAAGRMTPEQFDRAEALAETGRRLGIPLTGPEAIQQATGGATKLADVQRFVEGSPQSAVLAKMMAARPGQMRAGADAAFDTIAPQSLQPSTLGPRAAAAAQGAIDDVQAGINRATRPAYDEAGRHVMDRADFEPIAADPAFQASLRRLRSDEVLGPAYAGQPDNSVAVIDAVTKDMRDRGVALGNRANPGFNSQAAGLYEGGAAEARAIARDPARGGVQAYDDALAAQAQARRQNLEPLEQGPLGAIASASDTSAATAAVLPRRPQVGGESELADAVTRLAARDPDVVGPLVRQALANQADASMTRLVGGEAQGGGARFAKDVAGTEQQGRNLDAVLAAIERGRAPAASPREAVSDLLDVLRATGTRKPQGSPTDFNAQYRAEIGGETLPQQGLTALRTGGRSMLANAGDAARRAYLGRNNATLADLFAAPDSVQQIRSIVAQRAQTPVADAVLRAAVQGQAGRR